MLKKILSRRNLLRIAGQAVYGTSVAAFSRTAHPIPRQRPVERQPNIILIVADDLGYGDLGSYGQQQIQTPHLDRVAAEGMRFDQFYAGSPICAPSRSCLLTGLNNEHLTSNTDRAQLRVDDVTIAEVLKAAGYSTGMVGKWALGKPWNGKGPQEHGFDYYYGFLDQTLAHNYYPEYLWQNNSRLQLGGNLNNMKQVYVHDLFTDKALAFIQRHHAVPFFLYIPYTTPHANSEIAVETGDGMEIPSNEPYSATDWPQTEKNYAAMITRLDRDVGRILDRLEELGIDNDTILLFTSDNGPEAVGAHRPEFFNSAGPLRGQKALLYEGGIRVPMLARWPGVIPANFVSDHLWTFWDIFATLADIAGVDPSVETSGVSALPVLLGGQQPATKEYQLWTVGKTFITEGTQQAVRLGKWKGYRQDTRSTIELYDMQYDVGETHNVAERYPKVTNRVIQIMNSSRWVTSRFLPIVQS